MYIKLTCHRLYWSTVFIFVVSHGDDLDMFIQVYSDLEVAFVISEDKKILNALAKTVELLEGNTALISQYYYGCLLRELLAFQLADRRPPSEVYVLFI